MTRDRLGRFVACDPVRAVEPGGLSRLLRMLNWRFDRAARQSATKVSARVSAHRLLTRLDADEMREWSPRPENDAARAPAAPGIQPPCGWDDSERQLVELADRIGELPIRRVNSGGPWAWGLQHSLGRVCRVDAEARGGANPCIEGEAFGSADARDVREWGRSGDGYSEIVTGPWSLAMRSAAIEADS